MIYLIIAILLELIAAIADFLIPPGYADWLLYILPLVIVIPSNRQGYLTIVAILGSVLLILRSIIFPLELGNPPIDISRRIAGLAALWIMTFLLSGRIRAYTRIHKSAALNEAVLTSMTDGLVLASPEGEIIQINPAAMRIAGLIIKQEGLGKISHLYTEWNLYDLDGNILPVEKWPFSLSLRGEQYEGYICKVERKSVSKIWYGSFSGAPVLYKNGQLQSALTTFRDVTDIINAERRLRSLNEELAHKAADLETANHELEAFSYSASHDLRAPLNSILGFSNILMEDYGPELDKQANEFLSRISNSARDMAQLIDDLLSLSRASHQELKKQEINLSDIAQSIITDLKRTEPDHDVSVNIQKDIMANADPGLLRIALSNLLRNAWKFTKKTSHPQISFGFSTTNAVTVYFIRDNGAGFDMQYANRLFQPFKRLHTDLDYKGTGIGLSIVHRIITRHGGKIWAEGKVGKGATFYFTLTI
jgi:signal transduction histidine kinase